MQCHLVVEQKMLIVIANVTNVIPHGLMFLNATQHSPFYQKQWHRNITLSLYLKPYDVCVMA